MTRDFKGRHFETKSSSGPFAGIVAMGSAIASWRRCSPSAAFRSITPRSIAGFSATRQRSKRLRWIWRRPGLRGSWRIDETYIRVKGAWAYLYRAVDERRYDRLLPVADPERESGQAISRQGARRAQGLGEAARAEHRQAPTYAIAIAELKQEGKCPLGAEHRQVKYLNNVLEADHGKLKRLIKPTLGFKSMKTAYATIKGFEVMRALKKGQGCTHQLQDGIAGEVRLIERAFGLGPDALTEAIARLQDFNLAA